MGNKLIKIIHYEGDMQVPTWYRREELATMKQKVCTRLRIKSLELDLAGFEDPDIVDFYETMVV